jgi:hypothetical protein
LRAPPFFGGRLKLNGFCVVGFEPVTLPPYVEGCGVGFFATAFTEGATVFTAGVTGAGETGGAGKGSDGNGATDIVEATDSLELGLELVIVTVEAVESGLSFIGEDSITGGNNFAALAFLAALALFHNCSLYLNIC